MRLTWFIAEATERFLRSSTLRRIGKMPDETVTLVLVLESPLEDTAQAEKGLSLINSDMKVRDNNMSVYHYVETSKSRCL